MGGDEKALMVIAGRSLVQHASGRLASQVASLIVSANGDPARFAALAVPVVPDEAAGHAGPLAGILAALRWCARGAPAIRAVLSLPADTPFVPPNLVSELADALSRERQAFVAVAQSRGRRHHAIGLWLREAEPEIAAALARGELRAGAMADRLGAVAVPFPDLEIGGHAIDPFFNVNTPEDLAIAEKIVSAMPAPGIRL